MATLQTFGGGTTDFILDPGNGAKPLGNAPYTVIDGVTMLPASGLTDANGMAVTQLVSDADGRYAGSALLEGSTYWLDCVGARGPFRAGPQVSTTALAEVVAMGPQLNTIAASAAASAFSAKTAQAAAEAVQAGSGIGIDTDGMPYFDPSGLVPKTANIDFAIDSRLGGPASALLDPTGKIQLGKIPDLSATYKPVAPAKTWDTFTSGVAMHGLGGNQAPRSTTEAARGSIAAGCKFLDVDMRLTADSVPILAHDNDVTLGTNITSGLWRDQQSSNVGMVRWQPSRYIGGVWPDLQVATIAEFLDRFGGTIPMLLEPKNQTVLTDWQASIAAVAPLIKARHLERSVMISLYGTLFTTHAKTVKDAGLMLNVYLDSAVPNYNDPALIPSYQAAGVDMISLSGLTSDATIAAWKATGMKVTVSANGRRAAWDHLKSIGINTTVDDYAIYLERLNARAVTDPWRNGQWGSGDQPAAGHARPTLLTSGLRFNAKGADNRQMMLTGDFAPLPPAFTADLVVTVDTVPSGGKLGLAVCQQTDASFTDTEADPTGYQLWLTMGGVAQLYTRAANASTSRATSVQTPVTVTAAQTVYVRAQVTSTAVSISRLDAPNGNVMVSASYADTTWRGGYIHLMHFFNTATDGSYTVKSLTVTAN